MFRNDMNAFEGGSEFAFGRNNFQGRVEPHAMNDPSWIDDPFSPLETLVVQPAGEKSTRVMEEDIVVTGWRTYRLDTYSWWDAGPGAIHWSTHSMWDGSGWGIDALPDESAIDVTVDFGREMTASENVAFQEFRAVIEALTVAINALPDSAEVRLPNGAYVSGLALKALWAKTDFILTDNQSYQRGAGTRGEAAMIGNQPTISLNIQALNEFNDYTGGLNWLIAHEMGHLTQWGTPLVYDQRTANDIARAILSGSGLPYFATPGYGYSSGVPTSFSLPGSGGGNGGGGGGGDYTP